MLSKYTSGQSTEIQKHQKSTNYNLLTSSTSFNHRSTPSKDHLLVISYTIKTPWAPLEYDLIIVQNLPCPDVSHNCNLTRLPSSKIVVILYAVKSNVFWDSIRIQQKQISIDIPYPPQNGDSDDPSSKPLNISCLPTSLSPTSRNLSR